MSRTAEYNIPILADEEISRSKVSKEFVAAKLELVIGYNWKLRLTEQVKKEIICDLLNGVHEEVAAGRCRIPTVDWYRWKAISRLPETDERYDQELADFFLDVVRAQHEAEREIVENWRATAVDDWKAGQQFLAARFPERWNPTRKAEISGIDGGPLEFTLVMDTMASAPSPKVIDDEWEGE